MWSSEKQDPKTESESQPAGTFRVLGFSHERSPILPVNHSTAVPPNSIVGRSGNKSPILIVYACYWFALLAYSVTVRVLAAPGDPNSRALGRIDRAQDIEIYCIVASALLILAMVGQLAVIIVPMAAIAVGLCIMEAVRLSTARGRHTEHIMLCVLAVAIFLPMLVHVREGVVWYKWFWERKKSATERRAVHST